MMHIRDIQKNRTLVNAIDWDMTPEEAVRLYLEWGNNWARGNYVIRSKSDVTHYFVVNTWGKAPKLFLVRRNSDDCEELAEIDMPQQMSRRFLDSIGHHNGVYAPSEEIRSWLKSQLDA